MKSSPFLASILLLATVSSFCAELQLHTRRQTRDGERFATVESTTTIDPKKTAIVICDMWNQHWCKGATERVAEMAPRMNEVVKKARAQGVFIIHAPSDTMKFYEGTEQRKRAQDAPKVEPVVPLQRWCKLDLTKEAALPIDDSDGGCDDEPRCKTGPPWPWTRQIASLEIAPEDAVTDSEQAYFLMQQRGIDNVIVMGVHANMCVLGRPFSIRQMVAQGKNVMLMRDMTDTMYNSRAKPFVNHFRGTDLVVDHIEKYWAATITSADFVGGEPFRFKGDTKKKIVFLIGEPEYSTEVTLPEFAKTELPGFEHVFVTNTKEKPNDFPGLEVLKSADLLVVSVRRAGLSKENMALLREYLGSGRPMLGIRTASHAFEPRPLIEPYQSWTNFDREILGAKYENHYGKGPPCEVKATPEGARSEILNGVEPLPFKTATHLYKYRNVFHTATVLLNGQLEGNKSPLEPLAWINTGDNRRVFYTSLGSVEDFKTPQFRTLLRNGMLWAMAQPIPNVQANPRAAIEADQPNPLSPAEAMKTFKIADGLVWEQVLAEPIVAQPIQISFDPRGRMWVVQYLQYPNPAGLKMVSRDNFWRAVYDKVPPAPPNHVRGADKITIHEDTDGDGKFDHHKTFVDGLNITTSVAVAADGVWVLNPPYLQFYPDANRDDIPDGPPVTHLAGFGLEDTHSVANSLRFGPDGWLYGANGSTTTGNIIRPGLDTTPTHFLGQCIWRYHPPTKRFEVFAEGGGNAFGLEIDSKGRIFSGHNGGNTRGFHYVQGGYSQKGFEKHGQLSNPYAFGYFKQMSHPNVERFTHTFVINEGGALGEKFEGKLFGCEPLQGRIVMSEITPEGSTFKTRDLGYAVTTSDKWFRPVDIKLGPDGALYVADWYDRQVNHYRNHEGQNDPSNGRIYRLKRENHATLTKQNSPREAAQILDDLKSPNRTVRELAQRALCDCETPTEIETRLKAARGQEALELLWALNKVNPNDEAAAVSLLSHTEPHVRAWATRLLGDRREISASTATALAKLAANEPRVEVRSQLASTARRLKPADNVAIISGLANHAEDQSDPHLPLLIWWAVEKYPADFLRAFEDAAFWKKPLIQEAVVERLARRFAQAGTRQDFLNCARLFELSPGADFTKKLERGFEEGVKGRSLAGLPRELIAAMQKAGAKNEVLAVRLGDATEALKIIADSKIRKDRRARLIEALGESEHPNAVASLVSLIQDKEVAATALIALQRYNDPSIAPAAAKSLPNLTDEARMAALNLLASRAESAPQLTKAIQSGIFSAKNVPEDVIAKIRLHTPDAAAKIWGPEKRQTTGELQVEIDRLTMTLAQGSGSPYEGFKVYGMACATCHKLFNQGGQIGPDLTTYKRDDLANMLLNIVHPNAEIREGYVNYLLTTKDGRTLTGFFADEDKQVVTLRGLDGANQTIARAEIKEFKPTGYSLMPEGLLQSLEPQQLRDLFAYLRSTQPLVR